MTKKLLILFITIITQYQVKSQFINSHLFIEPNVAFSFDSSKIIIKNKFGDNQGFSFNYVKQKNKYSYLYIEAQPAYRIPSKFEHDSINEISMKKWDTVNNSIFSIYKKAEKIEYKGFLGYGVIVKVNKSKLYGVVFYCNAFFDGGYCTIHYADSSNKPIKSIEKEFKFLTSIIDGIKLYSSEDIERLDSMENIIKSKIKIIVDSIKLSPQDYYWYGSDSYRLSKYVAKVSFENINQVKIIEVDVPVEVPYYMFVPDKDGKIVIHFADNEKGIITKHCRLIIKDSFGRELPILFQFKYNNN